MVFPLRIDAHSLPFAHNFFDAVIAIDAYLYFGTDERCLSYISQFIKPGGSIGVVDLGFQKTGLVEVTYCDFPLESDWLLEKYAHAHAQHQDKDLITQAVLQGAGDLVGLFGLIAKME